MRVKCPTCKREMEWSASNPYRPFCSERCHMVDLGAWLAGERSIAGEPAQGLEGELPAAPPQRLEEG